MFLVSVARHEDDNRFSFFVKETTSFHEPEAVASDVLREHLRPVKHAGDFPYRSRYDGRREAIFYEWSRAIPAGDE